MLKKTFSSIAIIFLLFALSSLWLFPTTTPALGIASLLFSLAISIHAIFEKHKGTENPRSKIAKDTLVLILTLLLMAFLGGIAAMLANVQVGMRWGEVAGLISAIAASFVVGYLVRTGMMRFA